jgi:hypothetical protein
MRWPEVQSLESVWTAFNEDLTMSKGIDQKRETKKKPQHTKEEKRALKREKKRLKGQM